MSNLAVEGGGGCCILRLFCEGCLSCLGCCSVRGKSRLEGLNLIRVRRSSCWPRGPFGPSCGQLGMGWLDEGVILHSHRSPDPSRLDFCNVSCWTNRDILRCSCCNSSDWRRAPRGLRTVQKSNASCCAIRLGELVATSKDVQGPCGHCTWLVYGGG